MKKDKRDKLITESIRVLLALIFLAVIFLIIKEVTTIDLSVDIDLNSTAILLVLLGNKASPE